MSATSIPSIASTDVALDVRRVTKTYPGAAVSALREVSFQIHPGEIFGLLGPNGAGKTSLISILTTLESSSSGEVSVFGVNVAKNPQASKKQIGVVAQEVVNHGFFNVEEVLTFHSGYYGIWNNRERIHELLHALDLWEHRGKLVKQLSGGMKRRLMIAKALVHRPKLLLLDEPTAGVDVELRTKLWAFVRELQKSGTTILLTTHYLQEAEELCGRVGILSRGELKYVGPTRGIIEKLTFRSWEIDLVSPVKVAPSDLEVVAQTPAQIKVRSGHNACLGDVLKKLGISFDQVRDVRTREGSLEEAFRSVIEQKGPTP